MFHLEEEGATGIKGTEVRDTGKRLKLHRAVPHAKSPPAPNVPALAPWRAPRLSSLAFVTIHQDRCYLFSHFSDELMRLGESKRPGVCHAKPRTVADSGRNQLISRERDGRP